VLRQSAANSPRRKEEARSAQRKYFLGWNLANPVFLSEPLKSHKNDSKNGLSAIFFDFYINLFQLVLSF